MIANRIKPVVVATLMVAALTSSADATERRHHRDHGLHRHHHVENNRWDRQGDGRRNRPAEIDYMTGNLPGHSIRHVRQFSGFYGGGIDAYPVRGNGIYFLKDGGYWPRREGAPVILAPKAKIIDVEVEMRNNAFASQACAFEAGVCVIRGGN